MIAFSTSFYAFSFLTALSGISDYRTAFLGVTHVLPKVNTARYTKQSDNHGAGRETDRIITIIRHLEPEVNQQAV